MAGTAGSSGGADAGAGGEPVAGEGGTAGDGGTGDGGSGDGGSGDGGSSDGGGSDGGSSDGGGSGAPSDCETTLSGPARCELVASMDHTRNQHSATLLANGKVLVVGGVGVVGGGTVSTEADLASAELYDPSTDTWSPAGSLDLARNGHGAARLNDGRVLIAGGIFDGFETTEADLYDPSTNSWSPAESAPCSGLLVRLRNGRVLLMGLHVVDNTTALYDANSGMWSPTGVEARPRFAFGATLLEGGKVLVSGGFLLEDGAALDAATYDPATGAWSSAGTLSRLRNGHAPVRLQSGRVLISGGYPEAPSPTPPASTEIYDPGSNEWSAGQDLLAARWIHTATLLCDGRALLAGGSSSSGEGSAMASAELYDENSGEFSPTAPLNVARWSHTATRLPDGRVLIIGGTDGTNALSSVEICTHPMP